LKTDGSYATIALPAIAVAALERQRERQANAELLAGEKWKGNPWSLVFTTSVGTPLDASNVTHRFQRFLERAGMRRQRFHDLRHCCGTTLLAQGADLRTIMDVLRHSSITLTANTYAHLTPAMRRGAAAMLDAAFSDVD
jgi:integrase